jgi:hypothetical protein
MRAPLEFSAAYRKTVVVMGVSDNLYVGSAAGFYFELLRITKIINCFHFPSS